MVSYTEVKKNNTSLSTSTAPLTAVFVGGTNGIGLGALIALTKHTVSPTIYIVGRSEPRLKSLIDDTLKPLNDNATFHLVIAHDLAIIKDAQKAADQIVASGVKKIDLLIMSPGFISFVRELTPEGVDRVTSIRHYARQRFLLTLLPLLRSAPSPRVVSVLAAGQEGQLWPDDWTMEQHWGMVNSAGVGASLNTFMLEELAKKPENENLSFVHLYPGLVGGTGLDIQGLGAFGMFLLRWIAVPFMKLVGYTVEESGERVLYAATSKSFGKVKGEESSEAIGSNGERGSGAYLLHGDSSVLESSAIVKRMRTEGMGAKVYEHTMEVLERNKI